MIAPIRTFTVFLAMTAILFSACKKEGSQTAVKIDGDKITIDEFLRFYYTQNKIFLNMSKEEIDKLSNDPAIENHPYLDKSKFMDYIISRKLLYKKAMEDDSIDKKELESIVELSKMNAAATYYLTEKLKDEIAVSDEEVDKFYKENSNLFKGVPVDDNLISRIKQQIFLQKLEMKSNQFVLDLIAESKVNREGFKKYLSQKKKSGSEESANKDEQKKESVKK